MALEWFGTKMKLDGVRADVNPEAGGSWTWRVSDGLGRVCEGEEDDEDAAKRMAEAMLRALVAALAGSAT